MMAKPMKSLELHYPMIQFLIIIVIAFFLQDDEELKTTIAAGSKSLLPVPVQELIRMIFDVESMKKTLVEFEVSVT